MHSIDNVHVCNNDIPGSIPIYATLSRNLYYKLTSDVGQNRNYVEDHQIDCACNSKI